MSTNSLVPTPIAQLPWKLIFVVIAIGGFGALSLYSAAGGSIRPWAIDHIVRFCALLGVALGMSYVHPKHFKTVAFPAYGAIIIMLIIVELIGAMGGGAQSWLVLGPVRIQPSELMKPVVVLVVARFYDLLPAGQIRSWHAIWPAAALIGLPVAMILVQPDLGTSSLVLFSGLTVMFLAGLPLRLFVGGAAAMVVLIPLAYMFGLHDYQQRRVLIFLNPEQDPLGAGYHITQSKIAIGSGGLFGKGFLNGTQSHLHYLPEQHTDFIFPAMVEEWGLFGGLFLIACFALLFRWGMRVALDTRGRFERLTAAGLNMTIFFYFAINLLMVMGLAPVVGIPLPLFSYGGSAMMTVMICLGIMMAIDRNNRRERRGR